MLEILGYQLRIRLKNKTLLFWTLAFPLFLITIFALILRPSVSGDSFRRLPVAVVEETSDGTLSSLLSSLAIEQEKVFTVHDVEEDRAVQLLEEGEIEAIIYDAPAVHMQVRQSGIKETFIQSILDEYVSKQAMSKRLEEQGGMKKEALALSSKTYTIDKTAARTEPSLIYFYSALGMSAMYGLYWSLSSVYYVQANQGEEAARIACAPRRKSFFILMETGINLIIQFFCIALQLAYTQLFDVSFGDQLGFLLLLLLAGVIAGNAFGTALGALLKTNQATKINLSVAIVMLWSAMAGMFNHSITYYLQEHLPIALYLNPVAMISNGLYALQYEGIGGRYMENLFLLAVFALLCYLLSAAVLKKQSFRSLGVR